MHDRRYGRRTCASTSIRNKEPARAGQFYQRRAASVEVEYFPEKAFAFFLVVAVLGMALILLRMSEAFRPSLLFPIVVVISHGLLCRLRNSFRRLVNDLVELAAVQPDSAAIRAIIDFDPLPFRHYKLHIATYRTVHNQILIHIETKNIVCGANC